MSRKYVRRPGNNKLPTVTSTCHESLSRLNIIAALEESFNIVFDLFGIGKTATPPGNIINELRTDGLESMTILNKLSGKALTVQDSSDKEGVHIHQATRNDADHQRWYLRRARFIRSEASRG
jgi:hypothetical protein